MNDELTSSTTVLAVDDSPETLRFLVDALHAAGITVHVATSGAAALETLKKTHPHAVLMDAVMPGMSGFEACRQLKSDARYAHLPVIFMTGLSETEHVVEGFKSGGVDYVTKPIIADELIARILVHAKNARTAHHAGIALEAAGRALLAVDGDGQILWATARAKAELLPPQPDEGGARLPTDIIQWLAHKKAGISTLHEMTANSGLKFTYLAMFSHDETLLAVRPARGVQNTDNLRKRYQLTPREVEVLLWLTKGKSNKDIADILKISTRTIDKYLEQIYSKLGVENRVAATAMALAALNEA